MCPHRGSASGGRTPRNEFMECTKAHCRDWQRECKHWKRTQSDHHLELAGRTLATTSTLVWPLQQLSLRRMTKKKKLVPICRRILRIRKEKNVETKEAIRESCRRLVAQLARNGWNIDGNTTRTNARLPQDTRCNK